MSSKHFAALTMLFIGLAVFFESCLPRCTKFRVPLDPPTVVEEDPKPALEEPDTMPPQKLGLDGIGKIGRPRDKPKEPEKVEEEPETAKRALESREYPYKACMVRMRHVHDGRVYRGVPYTRRQNLQYGQHYRLFPKIKRLKDPNKPHVGPPKKKFFLFKLFEKKGGKKNKEKSE
jgi:hypothetical protein